jgi:hypothetical protein
VEEIIAPAPLADAGESIQEEDATSSTAAIARIPESKIGKNEGERAKTRRKDVRFLMHGTCDGRVVFRVKSPEHESTLKAATRYVAAGLSIIPIKPDCTNAPAIKNWKDYESRQPTKAELKNWFGITEDYPVPNRIGVIGGKASGNLKILRFKESVDFDNWQRFLAEEEATSAVKRMPMVRASNGDLLLFYRCEERSYGLDDEMENRAPQPAIDVLGRSQFCVVPPSYPACHGEERPYKVLRGELTEIPIISKEAREEILGAAGCYNENSPKDIQQIKDTEHEVYEKVWYYRNFVHWANNRAEECDGKHDSWVNSEAAKKVRQKYGEAALGFWTDFELGMMNGKLSALRWVLGSEWDDLDT